MEFYFRTSVVLRFIGVALRFAAICALHRNIIKPQSGIIYVEDLICSGNRWLKNQQSL
jgi:hypothetical protein